GKPVAEALGLDDWTIEIDNKSITHRPDLWCHRGIAGEIAAMHKRHLKPLDLTLPKSASAQPFPVRLENTACSRYLALPIDGVRSARSPDWLRARLFAVGQRPIDLFVDVSNFVMLDLGQPNHIFDRTRLSPEGIVVRAARAGESMKTLDGVERALVATDLLICSGTEPVALAGIMGGDGSKVAEGTQSLLLEVATFHAATVRRTAQRLGLRTDSSARFEKSLDPTLPMKAAAHLVKLLAELQPGLALPAPITDVGAWKDPARTIELRGDRVRQLLGDEVSDTRIAEILAALGFGVSRGADTLHVAVPSARATKDVTIEQDLVEEVGRIHRYGNIPEQQLVAAIAPPPAEPRRQLVRRVQDRLSGTARFHETLSYSFLTDAMVETLGLSGERFVQVLNPIQEGASRVRRSVVPSLLEALVKNRRHRAEVRLYEVGKGYLPEHGNARGEPKELHLCGLVWAGAASASRGIGERFDADRAHALQGVLDDLSRALGYPALAWNAAEPTRVPTWAHPGRAVEAAFAGATAPIALLAPLEPGLARRLGLVGELASDVACAELSIDALLASEKRPPGYAPIPKFPLVKVDVAVAIAAETSARSVVQALEKSGKGLVSAVELFDVYTGPNLAAGKKSLAFHVHLAADERTLTDQDVAKFLERVAREVQSLGGELRRE
ncbi:MAG: phenylalanine--tRNA ligase subunit beta, partial [Planctomycetes bacterium]|nr:phenylalanine--tRNA ligase subunit beta [Planctomycetota bacterium]